MSKYTSLLEKSNPIESWINLVEDKSLKNAAMKLLTLTQGAPMKEGTKSLNSLNLSPSTLDLVNKTVSANPAYMDFVNNVASYCLETFAKNEKEIDKKLNSINQFAIDFLSDDTSKEVITKITDQLKETFARIQKTLKPTLDSSGTVTPFEKIEAQLNGAKLAFDCVKSISNILNNSPALNTFKNEFTKKITETLQGDLGALKKIADGMNSPIAKALGANHAISTVIKGALALAQNVSAAR